MRPIKTPKLYSMAANRSLHSHAALSSSLQSDPTRPARTFYSKNQSNGSQGVTMNPPDLQRQETDNKPNYLLWLKKTCLHRMTHLYSWSLVLLHNKCIVTYKVWREVIIVPTVTLQLGSCSGFNPEFTAVVNLPRGAQTFHTDSFFFLHCGLQPKS